MIATVLSAWLLAQVGEEKGTYAILSKGQPAGTESFTFEEFEEGRVVFTSALRRGGLKSDAVLTLSAKDLRPLLYAAVHRNGRDEREIRMEWTGGKVRSGSKEFPFPDGTAVFEDGLITQLLPVLRRPSARAFDPSSTATRNLEILEEGERLFCGKERQLRARRRRVTFGGSTVTVYGDSIPILLEKGGTRWVLRGSEDLAEDPGTVLESREKYGIWTRPAEGEPVATALVLSDSPLLAAVALRLAAEGVGVLRFDDRGKTLADSVALALEASRDRGVVALLGHGESAILGLLMAERDPSIRVLFLLAGPGKPLSDAILDRADAQLSGIDAEQRKRILAEQKAQMDRIRDSKEDELEIDGRRTFVGRRRDLYRFDPIAQLGRVGCPVVVAQGLKDDVMLPANADLLEAALRGREGCEVRRFPNLGHEFGAGDPEFLKFLAESVRRIVK